MDVNKELNVLWKCKKSWGQVGGDRAMWGGGGLRV